MIIGHACLRRMIADTLDVAAVARSFVDAGRFVPGLTVDERGRARSWWWPLVAARDAELVASLCEDTSVDAQRAAAERLAGAVDQLVRSRLACAGVTLVACRAGRRTIPEAWLHSLTATDPWLSPALDVEKVRALERVVAEWVASGVAAVGQVRLCVRLREPERAAGDWLVELPRAGC